MKEYTSRPAVTALIILVAGYALMYGMCLLLVSL
jgi:hypothetical protein